MTIDFFYLSSFLGPTSPGAQPLSSVLYTLLKPPNTRPGIPDASPDPVNFQQSTPRSQNTCTSVAKHKAHPRILRQLVQRESGLHRDCSDLIRRLQRSSSSQRARRSSSRRTFFKLARSSSSRLARRPACLAAPCADGTARKQRHVREQATGADREREREREREGATLVIQLRKRESVDTVGCHPSNTTKRERVREQG
eukprot:scaffold96351_cov55-Phaeocystis_antarctica.AAC.1